METNNFLTKCADTENDLINFFDIKTMLSYAQLSKTNNKLIYKNYLYRILLSKKKYGWRHLWIFVSSCGLLDFLKLCERSNIIEYCSLKAVDGASKNGHIDVLEWWYSLSDRLEKNILFAFTGWAIDWASAYGQINVLNWWLSKKKEIKLSYTYDSINWASMNGLIDVLEWWKKSGLELKYTKSAITLASANGHTDVLTWWDNSGLEYPSKPEPFNPCRRNDEILDGYEKKIDEWKKEVGL